MNSTQDGRTATCVTTSLGYTKQALAAIWDDENTAWEDKKETDEVLLNLRYEQDDIKSFGAETLPPDMLNLWSSSCMPRRKRTRPQTPRGQTTMILSSMDSWQKESQRSRSKAIFEL